MAAGLRRLPRTMLLLCGLSSWPASADDWDLASVSVRAQVWEQRVLGKDQPEAFNEYDLVANLRAPWKGWSFSGWQVSARLMASIGVLRGADESAFVAAAIPALALVHRDTRISVDAGAGLALLSQHRFGEQDYGGSLQFALTLGVGFPLYQRFGIGYRFLHYSDAGAYGSHTIGADLHMIELSYAF